MHPARAEASRFVVYNKKAESYLEAIFRKPEIACEVLGRVMMQGRCFRKFGMRIRWSSILGCCGGRIT